MKIHKELKQRSPEWYELRRGVITGTRLKGLMGRTKQEHIYDLVAQRLTVEDPDENMMVRGARLEPEAMAFFQEKSGLEVEEVGFVSGSIPFTGLSPDGLIKVNGKYTAALEIKCLSGKHHVRAFFERTVPKEYVPQIVQYFTVMPTLQTIVFLFYSDSFTDNLKAIPVLIQREDYEEQISEAIELEKEVSALCDKYVGEMIDAPAQLGLIKL